MKSSILFVVVIATLFPACNKTASIAPMPTNDSCSSFIPFYEQQDISALSLSVFCDCLDTIVDLSNKLTAYTEVVNIDFNCDAEYFNQIPTMNSVTSLTSNTTTEHIVSAFPYLEVYKNKSYTKEPLSNRLAFLGNLREVVLLNVVNFPDFFATKSLEVFKMTFESTAEQTIELPHNLPVLRNLKELNIRDIAVVRFTNYQNLSSLEHLELSNVRWVSIPETENQWLNLKTLQLFDVELRGSRTLPDIFETMESLESVHISGTEVSTNTQIHLSKAPNLKELTFSFCEMENIPDELGGLASLNKLIIATEQTIPVITLPLSIRNLSNLKSIFVSTQSNQFPIALLGLNSTLESITIRDEIGTVPPEIGGFTALKELKLEHCGLTSLPPEIQNIADNLERLFLAGNNFDEAAKQQIEAWLPNTEIGF